MSLLARALFHNDAEAPNELGFRKGEILTVLNRSPEGLGGWWICNVRGKIGLAPGNRLQLLGVVQPTAEMKAEGAIYDDPLYDSLPTPQPSDQRQLPPPRASKTSTPNRVPPSRASQELPAPTPATTEDGTYQVPPTFPKSSASDNEAPTTEPDEESVYQVPKAPEAPEEVYSVPPNDVEEEAEDEGEELYQVPTDPDLHLRISPGPSNSNRSSGVSSMAYPPANAIGGSRDSKENLALTPDSQFEDYDASTASNGGCRPRPPSLTSPPRRPTASSCFSGAPNDYYNFEDAAYYSQPASALNSSSASSTPRRLPPQPPSSVGSFDDYGFAAVGADEHRLSCGSPGHRSLEALRQSSSRSSLPNEELSRLRHSSIGSSTGSQKSLDAYADMPTLPDHRLALSRETALERLEKVRSSTEANTSKLFKFISSKWKTLSSLVINCDAIRTTCDALAADVHEFIHFSYNVLSHANACGDAALPRKIWKHLRPLEEHHKAMKMALVSLSALDWRPEEVARACASPETDYLNDIVSSVRSISIDLRSLAVATAGNATVLFPEKVRAQATGEAAAARLTAPAGAWGAAGGGADSSSSGAAAAGLAEVDGANVDYLEMTTKRLSLQSQVFGREEREALRWYSAQMESGADILNQATDSLFKSIERGQPPNVFVQHSKFVVMSAQKLLYVADALGRSLRHRPLAAEVQRLASEICELLKVVVTSTKSAAERHPSPPAVQAMMDAVVRVSSGASRLQLLIADAASTAATF